MSVIIPTYKRADLLQQALDSVLAQEGVGDSVDMEIIVVDDASPDDTPIVMGRYPTVHYLRFENNRAHRPHEMWGSAQARESI